MCVLWRSVHARARVCVCVCVCVCLGLWCVSVSQCVWSMVCVLHPESMDEANGFAKNLMQVCFLFGFGFSFERVSCFVEKQTENATGRPTWRPHNYVQ